MLLDAGFAVLSEESGRRAPATDRGRLDPLDGSTNASRGVPWFATSLCVVDARRPGGGAGGEPGVGRADRRGARTGSVDRRAAPGAVGVPVLGRGAGGRERAARLGVGAGRSSAPSAPRRSTCASSPPDALDGYVDMSVDAHGVWDYLAGVLVCDEAGAPVVDALGRDLLVLDHDARRTPVAAATPELLDALLARRRCHGRPVASIRPRTRRAYSSVGQSTALTRQESGVRIPLRPRGVRSSCPAISAWRTAPCNRSGYAAKT